MEDHLGVARMGARAGGHASGSSVWGSAAASARAAALVPRRMRAVGLCAAPRPPRLRCASEEDGVPAWMIPGRALHGISERRRYHTGEAVAGFGRGCRDGLLVSYAGADVLGGVVPRGGRCATAIVTMPPSH